MKRLITLTAIILCTINALFAETPENRKENPHEIRIGIADSYMEACLENFAINTPDRTLLPVEGPFYEYGKLNHTGHIFVEYQHRINSWFSAGINADYLHSWYHLCLQGTQDRLTNSNFKISLIPTLRFTYFHNEMIDLYSAIGVGINYAHYIYQDDKFENSTMALAFDACALGVSVGKNHWFGAFELGGTTSIGYPFFIRDNKLKIGLNYEMPIPFARLLRVSVGYRF